MRKPPTQFRDRQFNPSYNAGYRAGFHKKPDASALRGRDVRDAYQSGLKAGRKDRRKIDKAKTKEQR